MKKRYFLCLFLLARCVLADDTSPIDPKSMLLELQKLQQKQSVDSKAQISELIQIFSSAASSESSATAFYEQAVKAVDFAGEKGENSNFLQWKKKDAEKIKSGQMAAQMHLRYLVLTLQRASGVTVARLEPALIEYTAEVVANHHALAGQKLMQSAIPESIFVQWYGIGKLFNGVTEWEMVPGNVDGIYRETLLPQMRTDKDARIIQYWDERIQRAADRASASNLTIVISHFNEITRPTLLWARAQDLLVVGQRNGAIKQMYSIIKENPRHLSAGSWISQLSAILSGAATSAAAVSDDASDDPAP